MRVDMQTNVEEAAASLSRLMDEFAAVSMHAGAPAIGGYRVVHAARPQPRPQRPQPAPLARSRRTPIRMTGTLAALIVSSLGVAAFSGPASCPCDAPSVTASHQAAAPSLTRFAYARSAVARAYRAIPQGEIDLASAHRLPEGRSYSIFETFELADSGEPVEASPINTATIEPAAYKAREGMDARVGQPPQRLTKVSAEAPKPIRLASADPIEVLPESSQAIAVRSVELSDETASPAVPEPKDEPVADTRERSSHKHAAAKHRTYRAYRSVVESRERKGKRLANIPPWAEKMFSPDWQSKAFSY